jgi:hypothetical protein
MILPFFVLGTWKKTTNVCQKKKKKLIGNPNSPSYVTVVNEVHLIWFTGNL